MAAPTHGTPSPAQPQHDVKIHLALRARHRSRRASSQRGQRVWRGWPGCSLDLDLVLAVRGPVVLDDVARPVGAVGAVGGVGVELQVAADECCQSSRIGQPDGHYRRPAPASPATTAAVELIPASASAAPLCAARPAGSPSSCSPCSPCSPTHPGSIGVCSAASAVHWWARPVGHGRAK